LLVIGLILAIAGTVLWYYSEQRLKRIEGDIQAVINLETKALRTGDKEIFMALQDPEDRDWRDDQERRFDLWEQMPDDARLPGVPQITDLQLWDDTAWVQVTTEMRGQAYKRVKFYRLVDGRWRHTGPDERYLGEKREKETEHFRFVYRERDEATVAGLAEEMEDLVEQICHDFQLHSEDIPRMIITVGLYEGFEFSAYSPQVISIQVPSPHFGWIPLEGQPSAEPLRVSLARWLATSLAKRKAGAKSDLGLWPEVVGDWEIEQLLPKSWQWLLTPITWRAEPFLKALESGEWLPLEELWRFSGIQYQNVEQYTLASSECYTVIEYIAEVYGQDKVPAMLVAWGEGLSWEESVQEVLNVGPGEFKASWLAFVREKYIHGH